MTDAVLDEILEELEEKDVICSSCDSPTISRSQWTTAGPAERQELLDEGWRPYRGRGLCRPCAEAMAPEEYRSLASVTVRQKQRTSDQRIQMVKEVQAHLDSGGILADIVGNYDIKGDSIRRALNRARRRGEI